METPRIIQSIVDTSKAIHKTVCSVRENRKTCERLNHRIQWIIGDIERLATLGESSLFVPSLERFQQTISDCLRFVSTFKTAALASANWSKELYESVLNELNQRLTDHVLDFNLTCQINNALTGKQDGGIGPKVPGTEPITSDPPTPDLLISAVSPQTDIQIPFSDLEIQESVGRGTFGDVQRGYWRSRNMQVALKKVPMDNNWQDSDEQVFREEILNLCRCRSTNTLPVLGFCIEGDYRAIVLEYMALGSLYDLFHQSNQQIEWQDRWSIALQMCQGLDYLHRDLNMVHGAIKSSNFLVEKTDSKYVIKLSDFGLKQASRNILYTGGLQYQAPELLISLESSTPTTASDVYALAIVLWELATLSLPWRNTDLSVLCNLAVSGIRMHIPSSVPALMTEIITSCWHQIPGERPSCHDLVEKLTDEKSRTRPVSPSQATDSARVSISPGTEPRTSAKSKNRKLVDKMNNLEPSFMDLRRSNITDEDIPFIVERAVIAKRCTHLLLSNNELTAEGVRVFVEKVVQLGREASRLHSLDLGGNPLGDKVTEHLAQLLSHADSKLNHLRLERVELTDEGVEQLSGALSASEGLTKLYLNDNGSITDASVDSLITMLKNLNQLEVLNCGLSDEGRKRLKDAAAARPQLKVLL